MGRTAAEALAVHRYLTCDTTTADPQLASLSFIRSVKLVSHFVAESNRKTQGNILEKNNPGAGRALDRLRRTCKQAKRTLLTTNLTYVKTGEFFDGADLEEPLAAGHSTYTRQFILTGMVPVCIYV